MHSLSVIRSESVGGRIVEELEARFAPLSHYEGEPWVRRKNCIETIFVLVNEIAQHMKPKDVEAMHWLMHSVYRDLVCILLEVLPNAHDACVRETTAGEVAKDVSVRVRWCMDFEKQRVFVIVRDAWAGARAATTQHKREYPHVYLGGKGRGEAYCRSIAGAGRYRRRVYTKGSSAIFSFRLP